MKIIGKIGESICEKTDNGEDICFGDQIVVTGSQRYQKVYWCNFIVGHTKSIEYIKESREARTCKMIKKWHERKIKLDYPSNRKKTCTKKLEKLF